MYIYSNKVKAFLGTLSESGQFLIFILLLTTVSENGKYGKLQIMDWNDIWYVPFLF